MKTIREFFYDKKEKTYILKDVLLLKIRFHRFLIFLCNLIFLPIVLIIALITSVLGSIYASVIEKDIILIKLIKSLWHGAKCLKK